MYDLIIIGAGPAGITAAIYAARRNLNFVVLSMDIGGQVAWSTEVENYTGMHLLSGMDLVNKFKKHMKDYKIKVKQEEVCGLAKKGKAFEVKTNKKKYSGKAVIIAAGKSPRKLNVPGEEKYVGKGVFYCALCDARYYRGKNVLIVGGGNSALENALFFSKSAKKVYVLDINMVLGGEPGLRSKVLRNKKVTHINSAKVLAIKGDKNVKSVKYAQLGKEKTLNVNSVFIEIGLMTKCDFAKVKKNKWGEVQIFRSTKTHEENMTSVPGIFSAGDVTDIPAKQIIVAAGEGAKAALAAFNYLDRTK
jgi:thioredoxin reductase